MICVWGGSIGSGSGSGRDTNFAHTHTHTLYAYTPNEIIHNITINRPIVSL